MTLLSGIALYFVIWWLCLFAVLPFGVRSQEEEGDVTLGTERGAPHQANMARKLAATTVLALVVFSGFYIYFEMLGLTLEDLIG